MSTQLDSTPQAPAEAPNKGVGCDALLADFEFLRVEVTRAQGTELYLRVPKGWRPMGRNRLVLGKAAKETTSRYDWDNGDEPGWEHSVEMQSCAVVGEQEAKQFKVYEVPATSSANDADEPTRKNGE